MIFVCVTNNKMKKEPRRSLCVDHGWDAEAPHRPTNMARAVLHITPLTALTLHMPKTPLHVLLCDDPHPLSPTTAARAACAAAAAAVAASISSASPPAPLELIVHGVLWLEGLRRRMRPRSRVASASVRTCTSEYLLASKCCAVRAYMYMCYCARESCPGLSFQYLFYLRL